MHFCEICWEKWIKATQVAKNNQLKHFKLNNDCFKGDFVRLLLDSISLLRCSISLHDLSSDCSSFVCKKKPRLTPQAGKNRPRQHSRSINAPTGLRHLRRKVPEHMCTSWFAFFRISNLVTFATSVVIRFGKRPYLMLASFSPQLFATSVHISISHHYEVVSSDLPTHISCLLEKAMCQLSLFMPVRVIYTDLMSFFMADEKESSRCSDCNYIPCV